MNVRDSVADPAFDALTNIEGTINVLEAARRISARVINISTGGAMYGDTDIVPTPESVEPLPEAPYGQSKYCAERYVALYTRLFGLRGATVRLGNVYGPRQDPFGEAGVVAIFCGHLQDHQRPTIYGTGRQTRDYVYVSDVIAGLLAVLDHPAVQGEYNIGTGRASSVLDIIKALEPYAESNFTPLFKKARTGEIERSCLDVTRARTDLGWSAQVDLANGLRHTAGWAQVDRVMIAGGHRSSNKGRIAHDRISRFRSDARRTGRCAARGDLGVSISPEMTKGTRQAPRAALSHPDDFSSVAAGAVP